MAIVKEVTAFPDIKVQIVDSYPDLTVYVTKTKSEAKFSDCVWYFEEGLGNKKIQFVNAFPDLKIKYVVSKSAAGWQNKTHKLQHRLT